jgi:hypothetical protein
VNKATRILLALGLILAVATPALAELKVSGTFRLQGYNNVLKDRDYEEGDSQSWVDQRLRLGVTNTINDNVSITYMAEVDTDWGVDNATDGGDGAFDGDGVNVESKWIYLDVKSGDTSARLGLQNYADEFEGLVVNGDMTGAAVKHKIGNTSLGLLYAKWDENDGDRSSGVTTARSTWDDTDFYGVTISQKFNDAFKAGAAVYFLDVNDATDPRANISTTAGATGINQNGLGEWGNGAVAAAGVAADQADAEVFFYGLTAAATFGDFSIDGFALLQDGELKIDSTNPLLEDQDSQAWAATVKAKMKLSNGDIGLRALYISEDDDADDNGYWMGSFGEYDFVGENQMIFLTDKFVCNATKERYAISDAAREGFGLMAFVLSGNHALPDNMYVNWGVGYYLSVDEERNDKEDPRVGTENFLNSDERDGDTLGYEVAVRFGKKFFEKVDVSLNAAYADFGDFYDNTVNDINGEGLTDPDAIYKTYLMVNVPF